MDEWEPADKFQPVYCFQCRRHIPATMSRRLNGFCATCFVLGAPTPSKSGPPTPPSRSGAEPPISRAPVVSQSDPPNVLSPRGRSRVTNTTAAVGGVLATICLAVTIGYQVGASHARRMDAIDIPASGATSAVAPPQPARAEYSVEAAQAVQALVEMVTWTESGVSPDEYRMRRTEAKIVCDRYLNAQTMPSALRQHIAAASQAYEDAAMVWDKSIEQAEMVHTFGFDETDHIDTILDMPDVVNLLRRYPDIKPLLKYKPPHGDAPAAYFLVAKPVILAIWNHAASETDAAQTSLSGKVATRP